MIKFIKLTSYETGEVILYNARYIEAIRMHQHDGYCVVQLSGKTLGTLHDKVKESIGEIEAAIKSGHYVALEAEELISGSQEQINLWNEGVKTNDEI